MKVPAITTNPPSNNNAIKPKRSGVFTMSNPDRPTVKGVSSPQNPTTPVVPRFRAATTQRTSTNLSSSTNPSLSARPSQKSLARKSRAESVASLDPGFHTLSPRPHISSSRPSSSASNRSFAARGQTTQLSQQNINGSPLFFHANQAGTPTAPATPHLPPTYTSAPGPKFFHADDASLNNNRPETPRLAKVPRGLTASPHIGTNTPGLAPTSSRKNNNNNNNHSPPSSRPGSVVGFQASPRPAAVVGFQASPRPASVVSFQASPRPAPNPRTPSLAALGMPESRNLVKFVYANGTEELLPPRKAGSEMGFPMTSPQLSSSSTFNSPAASPTPAKVAYPLSPLASPSGPSSPPYHRQGASSRSSSLDLKARHGRNISIGSVIELSSLQKEEIEEEDIGDADDEGQSGLDESGSSGGEMEDEDEVDAVGEPEEEYVSPLAPALPTQPMTAAERIKLMEERAANSRRERKVMDLEISNASLLAINKTLEKQMRRQAAELRRYKRLARSGKLSSSSSPSMTNLRSAAVAAAATAAATAASDAAATGETATIAADEDWDVDEEDEEDTETEKLSEEDDDDDNKSGSTNDEKHREADQKRLTLDLSKHQALLDASAKMNQSLRGCLLITDQLIKEGRKALEYKVRPSDVRLGGRILRDEDEDDDEALESVDGDGLFSAAEETETEAEETGAETETEAEETETEDEGGYNDFGVRSEELRPVPVRHSLV